MWAPPCTGLQAQNFSPRDDEKIALLSKNQAVNQIEMKPFCRPVVARKITITLSTFPSDSINLLLGGGPNGSHTSRSIFFRNNSIRDLIADKLASLPLFPPPSAPFLPPLSSPPSHILHLDPKKATASKTPARHTRPPGKNGIFFDPKNRRILYMGSPSCPI